MLISAITCLENSFRTFSLLNHSEKMKTACCLTIALICIELISVNETKILEDAEINVAAAVIERDSRGAKDQCLTTFRALKKLTPNFHQLMCERRAGMCCLEGKAANNGRLVLQAIYIRSSQSIDDGDADSDVQNFCECLTTTDFICSAEIHKLDCVNVELVNGINTCATGFVWRKAFQGDEVCVTPAVTSQAKLDNALASTRTSTATGLCIKGFTPRLAKDDDLVCVTPAVRIQVVADNAAGGDVRYVRNKKATTTTTTAPSKR